MAVASAGRGATESERLLENGPSFGGQRSGIIGGAGFRGLIAIRPTPSFNTDIPDQYRVDIWQQNFAKAERAGKLANPNLL